MDESGYYVAETDDEMDARQDRAAAQAFSPPPPSANGRQSHTDSTDSTDSAFPPKTEMSEKTVHSHKDSAALVAALDSMGVALRYNVRAYRAEAWNGEGWQPVSDRWAAHHRERISQTHSYSTKDGTSPLHYGRDAWRDALAAALYERETDPFEDWLDTLPAWDGTERIALFLSDNFEIAEPGALEQWASRFLFLGTVWRTYQPGTVLHEIPVLIGPQDSGKSTALHYTLPTAIPDLFSDSLDLSAGDKERGEALQGRAIVECSEMTGAGRADLLSLKAFITRADDGTFRAAFRENPEPRPRRCIIVGTSNEDRPLPNDPTGNRRFVPIKLTAGRPADLRRYIDGCREQLWAEAVALYRQGETARLPDDLKPAQREAAERARRTDEILEDRLALWLLSARRLEGFTLSDAAHGCGMLKDGGDTPDQRVSARLSAALKNLGCEPRQDRKLDGTKRRYWVVQP